MNKITVLKSVTIAEVSQPDATKSVYYPYLNKTDKVLNTVEITDEEINKHIMHNMHTPDEVDSAISLWNYIKSRINPQK